MWFSSGELVVGVWVVGVGVVIGVGVVVVGVGVDWIGVGGCVVLFCGVIRLCLCRMWKLVLVVLVMRLIYWVVGLFVFSMSSRLCVVWDSGRVCVWILVWLVLVLECNCLSMVGILCYG